MGAFHYKPGVNITSSEWLRSVTHPQVILEVHPTLKRRAKPNLRASGKPWLRKKWLVIGLSTGWCHFPHKLMKVTSTGWHHCQTCLFSTRGGGPSVNSVWGLRHTLCHRRCRAESRPPRPSTLGSSWCSRTHTPCSLARGKTACSVQSRQLYSSQEEQFICSLPSPDTQLKYSQARLLHFRGHRSTSISQHNETSGIQ